MPMPTPAQAAANWASAMAASTEKLKAGINAVTDSPMEKAASAVDRYAAGVARAAADGSYVNGLRAVSLAEWKANFLNKGVPRVASGATAAKTKMQTFMEQWLPYEQQVVQSLPPRGDTETNIQRAVSVMRANAAFVKR